MPVLPKQDKIILPGGLRFDAKPGQIVLRDPILKKPFTKIGLMEWLKV
jgi:hypothetical protein